jgi:uncharacterized protein (DUF1499 family)
VLGVLLACTASSAMFSSTPPDLGLHAGRLKPCPNTPNCVSSQAHDGAHIAPLVFPDAPDAAFTRLKEILLTLPRVRITAEASGYVRAEAVSRVFGFVDDLEFRLDADNRVVHVRSAARLGYSDFGVNRKRIETIRARFSPAARPTD